MNQVGKVDDENSRIKGSRLDDDFDNFAIRTLRVKVRLPSNGDNSICSEEGRDDGTCKRETGVDCGETPKFLVSR